MSVFWGIVGFAIGFNVAVVVAWWSLRRDNRKTQAELMLEASELWRLIHEQDEDRDDRLLRVLHREGA
jgi:hypothetical protein